MRAGAAQRRPGGRRRDGAVARSTSRCWDLKAQAARRAAGPRCSGRARDARARSTAAAASAPTDARAAARSSRGWARAGAAAREDQGRARARGRPRARSTWRARRSAPDAELMVDANGAYATAQRRCALGRGARRRGRRAGSRSRSELRRPRRPAPRPRRAPAGWRSPPASTAGTARRPAHARGGRGRRPAGRRHPLRRAHRRSWRRRARRGARRCRLSPHCAPAASVPRRRARCRRVVHLEYFHDHVRVERRVFDGAPRAGRRACCAPTRSPRARARAALSR